MFLIILLLNVGFNNLYYIVLVGCLSNIFYEFFFNKNFIFYLNFLNEVSLIY